MMTARTDDSAMHAPGQDSGRAEPVRNCGVHALAGQLLRGSGVLRALVSTAVPHAHVTPARRMCACRQIHCNAL